MVTALEIASTVPDPELPPLTLADLGILRAVTEVSGHVVVELTPTYSGCPALREIQQDIARRLEAAGYHDVEIRIVLSPAWTSDAITALGRRKLAAAGIAPPHAAPARIARRPIPLTLGPARPAVACPRCGSIDTAQTSAFSATACTALYRCRACAEPFDYLKEI
jgi:ring-1,2-phenylacetyl-CoA epoxidase subunit PaaD